MYIHQLIPHVILLYTQDQLTADDIKYVGQPVVEDDGTLVVAFFAQRPGGNVVDGDTLVNVVNDDSDVISAAVSCCF